MTQNTRAPTCTNGFVHQMSNKISWYYSTDGNLVAVASNQYFSIHIYFTWFLYVCISIRLWQFWFGYGSYGNKSTEESRRENKSTEEAKTEVTTTEVERKKEFVLENNYQS